MRRRLQHLLLAWRLRLATDSGSNLLPRPRLRTRTTKIRPVAQGCARQVRAGDRLPRTGDVQGFGTLTLRAPRACKDDSRGLRAREEGTRATILFWRTHQENTCGVCVGLRARVCCLRISVLQPVITTTSLLCYISSYFLVCVGDTRLQQGSGHSYRALP